MWPIQRSFHQNGRNFGGNYVTFGIEHCEDKLWRTIKLLLYGIHTVQNSLEEKNENKKIIKTK